VDCPSSDFKPNIRPTAPGFFGGRADAGQISRGNMTRQERELQDMFQTKRWLGGLLALAMLMPVAAVRGGDQVAVFKLKGALSEAPSANEMSLLLSGEQPLSMFDLLEKLRKARKDSNLKAVVFEIEQAGLGLAQIQELRAQFEALRAADKDVWIHCETLSLGHLLLASAASRVVMMPRGEVDITGLYGESLYFKNMLDKIGVEADILHCGDYKSAGEPFYRTGPSKEDEEQTNRLIDSMFGQLVEQTAKSRKLTADAVKELIDKAILSAAEAQEAKLIDKLQYREDFVASVRKAYGEETEVVFDYGEKKGPEIDFDNPFAIFKLFGEVVKGPSKSTKKAVAVVFVEGAITSGETEQSLFGGTSNAGSETIRRAIAHAARDESVQALVLRVDSPGGSAIASEVICEATKRFKKSGRPFIVSMGNVAGSGGYYVATLGDTIYAQPGTITGSIGVVGGKIVTKGLWDWVGVTGHEYKRGKHADVMNTNRKFTDAEKAVIGGMMNRVYDEFKDRVKEGRGSKLKGDLEKLAGGRVYTGHEALEIGLVDRLGGFADAIKFAASEADLGSEYEVRVYPRPKSLIDIIAEAFSGKSKEDKFVYGRQAPRIATGLAAHPSVAPMLQAISAVDPAKAKSLENALRHLEMMSGERVLLIGPAITTYPQWISGKK